MKKVKIIYGPLLDFDGFVWKTLEDLVNEWLSEHSDCEILNITHSMRRGGFEKDPEAALILYREKEGTEE